MSGLSYFVGKVCTVFTVQTNRDFKSENHQTFPQPIFHYFVGKVLEVTPKGIFMEQWNSSKKLKTFFFMDYVVSISEEEILNPSDPKDREIIEEFRKVNESSAKKAEDNVSELKKNQGSQYMDIDRLASFSKKPS